MKQQEQEREISNPALPLQSKTGPCLAECSFTQPEAPVNPMLANDPVFASKEFAPTTSFNKEQKTAVHSAVIDENGGSLSCFGCKWADV